MAPGKLNSFQFRRGIESSDTNLSRYLVQKQDYGSPAITVHLGLRQNNFHHFISNLDASVSLLKSFGQMQLLKGGIDVYNILI